MTNRSDISINSIDFDGIKSSLKAFLQSQDTFRDYNFEGAGLNIMLDILAANTHYQAFYANMVANEAFLDSCRTIQSAASISKHLNYVPRSYRGAITYVDVYYNSLTEDQQNLVINGTPLYLLRGTTFTAKDASGRNMSFVATDNYEIEYQSGQFVAKNVEIKQGTYSSVSYVADNNNESLKYIIPDPTVDTTTILVRVQKSITDTQGNEYIWKESTDVNTLNSESRVYFVQRYEDKYEIYFGDGILGRSPENGNLISVTYLTTLGEQGNGIGRNETSLVHTFTNSSDSTSTVKIVQNSDGTYPVTYGGAYIEDLSSIKYYAPKNYQAQDRAVTSDDYRTLIAREYSEGADSVFVWGGEDNEPPIYGKVFISLKPTNALKFTQSEKSAIARNIIKSRNLISITPEIVDPEYIYLIINCTVSYDQSKTSLTPKAMQQLVSTYIATYGDLYLDKFDRNFRYSNFLSYIDDINPSILSSDTDINLMRTIDPRFNISSNYTINYNNELYHPIDGYTSIVTSNGFGYIDGDGDDVDCYLEDDGLGTLKIYKLIDQEKVYVKEAAGTIDYDTGKLVLVNFKPTRLTNIIDSEVKITVVPNKRDVISKRNQIVTIDYNNITVTCSPESIRSDPYSSGANFPYSTGT